MPTVTQVDLPRGGWDDAGTGSDVPKRYRKMRLRRLAIVGDRPSGHRKEPEGKGSTQRSALAQLRAVAVRCSRWSWRCPWGLDVMSVHRGWGTGPTGLYVPAPGCKAPALWSHYACAAQLSRTA